MEEKVVSVNRIAYHEYFVEESYQAGIVLKGSEVKSLRMGNANLKDSFCLISKGEMFLKNAHISVYDKTDKFNLLDAKRDRKLLLNKYEILKLGSKIEQKGYTLVPLKIYFKGALVKVEIGLCKGKHTFDKKRALMDKDIERKVEREVKEYYR